MATVTGSDTIFGYRQGIDLGQPVKPPKAKSQKRREQRKRAKERKRTASVEASAIGRWYGHTLDQMDELLKEHVKKKPPEPQAKPEPIDRSVPPLRSAMEYPDPLAEISRRSMALDAADAKLKSELGPPWPSKLEKAEAEVLRLRAKVVELMKRNGELGEKLELSEAVRLAQGAQIRKLEPLAEILAGVWKRASMPGDWACAKCRPESDIIKSGFECYWHRAEAFLCQQPKSLRAAGIGEAKP